jgi:hypothetical protein
MDDRARYSCLSISDGFNSGILIARSNIDLNSYRVNMLNVLYFRTNRHIEKEFGPKNGPDINALRTDYSSDSGHAVDGTQGCGLRVKFLPGHAYPLVPYT